MGQRLKTPESWRGRGDAAEVVFLLNTSVRENLAGKHKTKVRLLSEGAHKVMPESQQLQEAVTLVSEVSGCATPLGGQQHREEKKKSRERA